MEVSTIAYNVTSLNGSLVDMTAEKKWGVTYRGRNILIGVVGTVLNVLTLVAVVKHRDLTKLLRCALVSLVSTDLGFVASMFIGSLLYSPPDALTWTCIFLVFTFMDCTALTLFVVALDRVAAVFAPRRYSAASKRNVKIVLSVSCPWVLAVALSAVSMDSEIQGLPRYPVGVLREHGVLVQGVVLLVCGTGVLLAYLALAVKLSARRRVVHPAFVSSGAARHVTPAEGQRCRRLTVHLAFLAVWFCVIYIPFASYLLTLYGTGADRQAEFNSPRQIVMSTFITVNSISNPFIFFWRLVGFSSVRQFLRKALTWRATRGPQEQPAENVEMGRLPTARVVPVTPRDLTGTDVRTPSNLGSSSTGSDYVGKSVARRVTTSNEDGSSAERPEKTQVIFSIPGTAMNSASSYPLDD